MAAKVRELKDKLVLDNCVILDYLFLKWAGELAEAIPRSQEFSKIEILNFVSQLLKMPIPQCSWEGLSQME